MIILEMFDELPNPGRRTDDEDNTSLQLKDLRKTKLTLAQINRLRIMNDVRKLEYQQKLKKVQKQYAAPAGDSQNQGMPM